MNRRVRGSPIEDLKLRRGVGRGRSQSICLWSYYRSGFKLYPFADDPNPKTEIEAMANSRTSGIMLEFNYMIINLLRKLPVTSKRIS
jgi:hypothetical protein